FPVAVRLRRRHSHVDARGAQPLTQRVHVHFGAADALGKVPAEQVNDLHAIRWPTTSNTFRHAVMTSAQSASLNAAEIGSRISEAATRSVTGRVTGSMRGDSTAYGAEWSGM